MKKLMIAAAIACAAAMSQAASVTWGGAAGNPDWTPDATGQYAYLLYGSSDAAIATVIQLATAGDIGAALVGQKADNGYTVVSWYQLVEQDNTDGYFTSSFVRDDSKGGVNGYYQIVLADTDHEFFDARKADAVVAGITDMTPGGGKAIYNTDFANDPWIGDSGFSGKFSAAPEPTSGLLLLIGMAGLALKRKRA